TYTYNKSGNDLLSNRLYHVHDGVSSTARSNDYDGSQTANTNSSNAIENDNYFTYDNLGSIKENRADGFAIEWTASRKVKAVTRLDNSKPDADLEFKYDAFGRRICKIVKPRKGSGTNHDQAPFTLLSDTAWTYEYYALDASGNTIATYTHKITKENTCSSAGRSTAILEFNTINYSGGGAYGPVLIINISKPSGSEQYSVNGSLSNNFKEYIKTQINSNTSSSFTAELSPEICDNCLTLTSKQEGSTINTTSFSFSSSNYSNPITIIKSMSGASTAASCGTVTSSKLKEHLIYADARLGVLHQNKTLSLTSPAATSTNYYSNTAGKRSYELTNWLGSVISVVSDMKYWSSEARPGTIYQTSFEGGDEKMFIGSDGSYTSSADRASEGSKSLKLDATTANEDLYGPNVREFVKAGNVVEISAETYWLQNTNNTYNRGGGIVYSLIDNDGNFLKDASGNNIWHEITLNGAWGDDPNEWNHQEENWTIPSVYKNGVLYGTTNPDENITLHVYPYNALGISNTTFYDELKVSISRSNETEEFFAAVIEESADYHEFGMRQEGRGIKGSNKYSYGYQGSREDNEISGDGNSYTTEFRQLDTRLGRWFSVDPVFQPNQSPYTSMDNDPINLTDIRGTDTKPENVGGGKEDGGGSTKPQPAVNGTTACAHCHETQLSGPEASQVDPATPSQQAQTQTDTRPAHGTINKAGTKIYFRGGNKPNGQYYGKGAWVDIPTQGYINKRWREVQKGIDEARKRGATVSADNLQRWLNGIGGHKDESLAYLRSFQSYVDAISRNRQRFLYGKESQPGSPAQPGKGVLAKSRNFARGNEKSMTYTDSWDAQVTPKANEDEFFYAYGISKVVSGGTVTFEKTDNKNLIKFKIEITNTWSDSYDWELGMSVDIDGTDVNDVDMLLLEQFPNSLAKDKHVAKPFTASAISTEVITGTINIVSGEIIIDKKDNKGNK
ncbi:MAG: RHS repeat-associated core domain-containing protein, partial [Flavobacteriales bacterium]